MQLGKDRKIESVVSKDPTRAQINNVWLQVGEKESYLIATDGRALSKIEVVTDSSDVTGWITPKALKEARKQAGKLADIVISANGSLKQRDGSTEPRPEFNPPQYSSVIASAEKSEKKMVVAFNAKLLAALADTFGENCIELSISDNKSAIEVRPVGAEGYGLIMPMKHNQAVK